MRLWTIQPETFYELLKAEKVIPPLDTQWDRRGKFIQATFWELCLEQVVDVRHFKGRQKQRR